ncbi:peptide/nickel transport system permease protein [Oceanobacillus limi]|uniref:Peptide/nickel transport system permease protein n=1 Tax=Oceanobacillus limi TaxID=930131 RepID=A0A1H9YBE4_9BACI|nr:ABC transporter permease [Oceanobacillus limi]SES66143.1 peptide/nickel transport system permease protein [Oceanobacillus limi]
MGYLKRSLLQIIPSLLILTLIVFALVYVAGDPVSQMLPENATAEDRAILTEALGLDEPFHIQYLQYLGDMIRGDFGTSYQYQEPALELVTERLAATLTLSLMALSVAIFISIPLGILAALKRNTVIDFLVSGISVVGKAMPNFWIGIMLILFFAVMFPIFPVSGADSPLHFVLPSITLGVALAAEMTRLVRASVLEVIEQEYVQTARSKGQMESIVIGKHVFLNSLIPVVTIIGLQFPQLIGGAIVVETVFSWPGIGRLLLTAIETSDMAVVQAIVFVIALITIVVNLVTDIIYRVLDPRIKYN